jgi:hypothetical protein
MVCVPHNHDAGIGGDVQETQHVALGQRGNQKFLWIPSIHIAKEGFVRRTLNIVLAWSAHNVVATVLFVTTGASATIPTPGERHLVVMT